MDVGIQDLTAGSKPPPIRVNPGSFTTWMGDSPFRPLVALSQPNYGDADQWKPIVLPAALAKKARTAFREALALDLNCDDKPSRNYPDRYIQTLHPAYRSARGDILLALRADPTKNRCGESYGEWQSAWFLMKGGAFAWIGSGLTLLDIGDYGGEGSAAVVFQSNAYDRDGYLLLDPRDGSKVEYSWSYH
ncbi:MAG: hypothetical protein ACLQAT_24385 [Candidatus Binataceae bacterium]